MHVATFVVLRVMLVLFDVMSLQLVSSSRFVRIHCVVFCSFKTALSDQSNTAVFIIQKHMFQCAHRPSIRLKYITIKNQVKNEV
jgi:hypothetical protein